MKTRQVLIRVRGRSVLLLFVGGLFIVPMAASGQSPACGIEKVKALAAKMDVADARQKGEVPPDPSPAFRAVDGCLRAHGLPPDPTLSAMPAAGNGMRTISTERSLPAARPGYGESAQTASPTSRGADATRQTSLRARYLVAIESAVRSNWVAPDGVINERCLVHISQLPGGTVENAVVDPGCPYDEAGRKSVMDAVLRSSPFPYTGFESVWNKRIDLFFQP